MVVVVVAVVIVVAWAIPGLAASSWALAGRSERSGRTWSLTRVIIVVPDDDE